MPRTSRDRVTLADVAREAGVSVALVSIVMRGVPGASPANRARVREVASRLGYVPDSRARVLRQGASNLLGVMYGLQEPFHADLVEGVYAAAAENGYDVVLSAVAATRPEEQAVETLLADRCEAVILLGPMSATRWLTNLAARVPLVVVARGVSDQSVDVVRTADAKGIQLAVEHVVELGHERIAHVDGGDYPGADSRRRGYRDAMRRHGLDRHIRVVHGGVDDTSGANAAGVLLDLEEPPTAILAFNDRCATGVLDAVYRRRRSVPDDISVVGFDDAHVAGSPHINLTTVRQDASLMARLAVTHAISKLERGGEANLKRRETVVPPTLIVRGTTAPADNRRIS